MPALQGNRGCENQSVRKKTCFLTIWLFIVLRVFSYLLMMGRESFISNKNFFLQKICRYEKNVVILHYNKIIIIKL